MYVIKYVCVAQLDRALGYGPRCREFESSHARPKTLWRVSVKSFLALKEIPLHSISYKAKSALKNRTLFAHEGVKKIVAKGQRNPLGTAKYEDIYYKEAIHYKIRFCKDNLNKMFIVIIFIFTFVYAKIVRIRNVSASERGITYE